MTTPIPFVRVFSGAIWEDQVGYCRALRSGNLVFVTGTAPIDDSGTSVHAPGDAEAQAARCLDLIERALHKLDLADPDVRHRHPAVARVRARAREPTAAWCRSQH